MLNFLKQEKDPLESEKEQLEKHLAQLQRQSQELERKLQNQTPQELLKESETPKPAKIARFVPDEEFVPMSSPRPPSSNENLLKIQKRITRNRVIKLSILAVILLIIIIRTLF